MGPLEPVRRLDLRRGDVVGARDLPQRVPFPDHVRGIGKGDGGDRREHGKRDDGYQQSLHIRNISPIMPFVSGKSIPQDTPRGNIKIP